MKYFTLLFTAFLLTSCTPTTSVKLSSGKTSRVEIPPGTVKINDNLFADDSEITNVAYQEYLYWVERIYTKRSASYLNALPNYSIGYSLKNEAVLSVSGSSWVGFETKFDETHFQNMERSDLPCVGLSYEQALAYSTWRTNMVAEVILNKKGWIKTYNHSDKDTVSLPKPATFFTIDRYKAGGFSWIIKQEDIALPIYTLPTNEEWESLAKTDSTSVYGIDSTNNKIKQAIAKKQRLLVTKETCLSAKNDSLKKVNKRFTSFFISTLESNDNYIENKHGLYHVVGNVAEMINDKGFCKGGSWHDPLAKCKITEKQPFTSPNAYTGFRNVCHFEMVEAKKLNKKENIDKKEKPDKAEKGAKAEPVKK
ncbi:MAG: hypothetical protein RI894_1936 [Bacteroidota bacterium]|jgi:formylglycine-generating enzyme required for sulfatase activity